MQMQWIFCVMQIQRSQHICNIKIAGNDTTDIIATAQILNKQIVDQNEEKLPSFSNVCNFCYIHYSPKWHDNY